MVDPVNVCRVDELSPGQMKLVEVDGEEVAVANVDGTFYAFANECTHSGGPLAEGELQETRVTCPWHFTTFDIRSGQALDGPGKEPISVFDVQIVDDDVRVTPRA